MAKRRVRCRNPNLGLTTKAKVCGGAGQKWRWESHFMLLGVWENVKEWTPTLPSELTLGVGLLMDSQIFKERLQESKPIRTKSSLYHWKSHGRRCLKWAHMPHLGSWNISYGQKNDWESNWQFDTRPLKAENRPNFLACRWLAT